MNSKLQSCIDHIYTAPGVDEWAAKRVEDVFKRYEMMCEVYPRVVPKAPVALRTNYEKGVYSINYHCPRCNTRLISRHKTTYYAGNINPFCSKCGQHLKWSEQ